MRIRFAMLICLLSTLSYSARAQDWPDFARYRDSNTRLLSMSNAGDRVVFMGNSITDFWISYDSLFFLNNHFVDRGISGQTTPQMLVRFRADVIGLKPKAVVMLCGINDIAGNTGPSTLEMIENNIQSMAELAKFNGIQVLLCSVLPAHDFPWKPNTFPTEKIIALNQWIRSYAEKNHFAYVNYFDSLTDDIKGMKKSYSEDGVHPNKQGYEVMESILLPVIRKSVKLK